jgi:hypothetical protein
MNRYQKAQAAKTAARKAEKKAAKQIVKKFPETLRVIVHGETDFIEFTYPREDLERIPQLSSNEMTSACYLIGTELDKPELGNKLVKDNLSIQEMHKLGEVILMYAANLQITKALFVMKAPVLNILSSRSFIGNKEGYALRPFGAYEYDGSFAQGPNFMECVSSMYMNGILRKAFMNGEYHPSSIWYKNFAPLFNIKAPSSSSHTSGWSYQMSEAHKKAIGDAHRGLKYKTKALENIAWKWIENRKVWL